MFSGGFRETFERFVDVSGTDVGPDVFRQTAGAGVVVCHACFVAT